MQIYQLRIASGGAPPLPDDADAILIRALKGGNSVQDLLICALPDIFLMASLELILSLLVELYILIRGLLDGRQS